MVMTQSRSDWPDQKPTKRGECLGMPRPCPFMSCRHHLVTLKGPKGRAKDMAEKDDATVEQILSSDETCSLDVADRVAIDAQSPMDEVGHHLGISRERVRQIEMLEAAPKMQKQFAKLGEEFSIQRGFISSRRLSEPKPLKQRPNFRNEPYSLPVRECAIEILGTEGNAAALAFIKQETGRTAGKNQVYQWRTKSRRDTARRALGPWGKIHAGTGQINAVLDLIESGESLSATSRATGVHVATVARWKDISQGEKMNGGEHVRP